MLQLQNERLIIRSYYYLQVAHEISLASLPSDNCSAPAESTVATNTTDEVPSECYSDNSSDSMECNGCEEVDDDHDQYSCRSSEYQEESETAAYDLRSELESTCLESDPVYPGARISNAISMLLIMTFVMTHKITGVALKDLLSLIDIHCLMPHRLIQSLYKFKQYFSYVRTPLMNYYYCSNCSTSVSRECKKCPNALCQAEISEQNRCFFIQLSIIDQLKAMFSRKAFIMICCINLIEKRKIKIILRIYMMD